MRPQKLWSIGIPVLAKLYGMSAVGQWSACTIAMGGTVVQYLQHTKAANFHWVARVQENGPVRVHIAADTAAKRVEVPARSTRAPHATACTTMRLFTYRWIPADGTKSYVSPLPQFSSTVVTGAPLWLLNPPSGVHTPVVVPSCEKHRPEAHEAASVVAQV